MSRLEDKPNLMGHPLPMRSGVPGGETQSPAQLTSDKQHRGERHHRDRRWESKHRLLTKPFYQEHLAGPQRSPRTRPKNERRMLAVLRYI
jgi:hypothetical protein